MAAIPVPDNSAMFEYAGHRLSDDAQVVLKDWFAWCSTGTLSEGGVLADVQHDLAQH